MFYITFPFKLSLLDIEVQVVFPPTLGVMERERLRPSLLSHQGRSLDLPYPPSTSGKWAQEAFLPRGMKDACEHGKMLKRKSEVARFLRGCTVVKYFPGFAAFLSNLP